MRTTCSSHVRTLAALIASQGLVPAEIGGKPVSHAHMAHNKWRRGETIAGRPEALLVSLRYFSPCRTATESLDVDKGEQWAH